MTTPFKHLLSLLGVALLLTGCTASGSPGGESGPQHSGSPDQRLGEQLVGDADDLVGAQTPGRTGSNDNDGSEVGENIVVNVANRTVKFDRAPIVDRNVTYVQVIPLAEQLGLTVGGVTNGRFYGSFSLAKNGLHIEFKLGDATMLVNNRRVDLPGAPFLQDGELFVPIRSLAAAANYAVDYLPGRSMFRMFPSYRVVGYFTSWGDTAVSDIDGNKLTHVNYAFANIVDGVPALSPIEEGLSDPYAGRCRGAECTKYASDFKAFRQLREKHPHVQVLVSVGGWTWSGRFSDTALTEASRERFAEGAVQFLRRYELDGIDIDWEYPVAGGLPSNVRRPVDRENFTLLLRELRARLDEAGKVDGKYYLLTIASAATPDYPANTELDEIADIVDFINIMTYDFHGDWETVSGHNAPLYFDPQDPNPRSDLLYGAAAVNGHLNAGVPPKKLVMGIPFYERSWGGCEADNDGLYQTCDGADGTDDPAETGRNGFVRRWNDRAKVPYAYDEETGRFVSYEDAESISYKAEFIKSRGLGGAMFWAYNGDESTRLLERLAGSLMP